MKWHSESYTHSCHDTPPRMETKADIEALDDISHAQREGGVLLGFIIHLINLPAAGTDGQSVLGGVSKAYNGK